MGNKYPLTVSY